MGKRFLFQVHKLILSGNEGELLNLHGQKFAETFLSKQFSTTDIENLQLLQSYNGV